MLQLGNKITVGEPIYKFQNNHSVDFDGVDDFIQLGQGFTYTQNTVSAWIKLGELSRTHTILSGRDSNTDLIRFWIASSDNKVRFRLGDGSNTTVTNPTALQVDRWYHIVATYDGTNLKIYVDSVLGHTLAASKNVNVTANLKIGEDDDSNRFMGKIDELAIWDRALTQAEVTEIYNGGKPTNLKLNSGNYKSADPVIVSTKSVDFDGIEAYLEVQANSTFAFGNNNFTLSSWFNLDDLNTGYNYVVAIGNNSSGQQAGIGVTNEKKLFLSAFSSPIVQTSALQIEFGKWNNIVASYTGGSTDAVSFYLNGVLIDTLSISLDVQVGKVMIGAHVGETSFFNGQIDEVGIFNAALTSDQVIELYNQGVPSNLLTSTAGEDGTLVGYWKMGDGTLDEAPLIADQTNATLGSDLVDNGNFATDSDWTFNSAYWNISGGTANALGVANGSFNQTLAVQSGKIYKIEIASTITSGNGIYAIKLGTTQQIFNNNTSNITAYLVASGDNVAVSIQPGASAFSVSSITVKQVNGNPALMVNTPTIVTDAPLTKIRNYYRMGDGILDFFMSQTGSSSSTLTDGIICDMIEPSLGTELILNGNFATLSNWNTGSGWTIDTANNRAVRDDQQTGNSQIHQTIAVDQDKIYRVEYTREYLSGTGQTNLFSDFVTDNSNTTRGRFVNTETNKLITVVTYFQPQYTGNFILQVYGIGTFSGRITNVSMKEVNGNPGLMQSMSESNITNDVPS